MTQCQGAQGARDFSPPKFFMISNTSEENNDKSFPYELNDWILPTKKKKKIRVTVLHWRMGDQSDH